MSRSPRVSLHWWRTLAVLVPNDGLVTQRAGDPFFADSFFDVFFALDLPASDPAL